VQNIFGESSKMNGVYKNKIGA